MLNLTDETSRLTSAAGSAPPARQTGKFNVFQRLVRQWESLHPYNGLQVLKIRGRVDLAECNKAWHAALESLGLGTVWVSDDSYVYRQLNGEAAYHGVAACPEGTQLESWITGEMNRRYDPSGSVPFRPFVIQESGHFWMGLGYQHWVADSASIRMLIHEWFARQFDPAAARGGKLRFSAGGYWSLFGPHREGWRTGDALLSSMRWHSRFRRARRIEDPHQFRDMSQQFALFSTPDGLIDDLRAAAKKLGVTVNDIFLAAIALTCHRYVPAPQRFRRRELAIGTIVDLRPGACQPLGDVFDLLLGFTSVWCRTKDLGDWRALVQSVGKQTDQHKRSALPLTSCLRTGAGVMMGKCLSSSKLIEFYRKRVALAGAGSNVNLNRCWAGKYAGDPLLEYLRVAPTGPMTPLVFATSTLGSRLTIGLTYRPGIIPPASAGLLGEDFVTRLGEAARFQ
jgi:hypothetical protein